MCGKNNCRVSYFIERVKHGCGGRIAVIIEPMSRSTGVGDEVQVGWSGRCVCEECGKDVGGAFGKTVWECYEKSEETGVRVVESVLV